MRPERFTPEEHERWSRNLAKVDPEFAGRRERQQKIQQGKRTFSAAWKWQRFCEVWVSIGLRAFKNSIEATSKPKVRINSAALETVA